MPQRPSLPACPTHPQHQMVPHGLPRVGLWGNVVLGGVVGDGVKVDFEVVVISPMVGVVGALMSLPTPDPPPKAYNLQVPTSPQSSKASWRLSG